MSTGTLTKNLIILSALSAMIFWFYTQTHANKPPVQTLPPQEYMTQIKTTTYDNQGQPKETMHANYWEFNSQHEYSDILEPYVTINKPNGETWNIRAHKAQAWHKTVQEKVSKLDMLDGVIIERQLAGSSQPMVLKTKTLQYMPGEQKISTHDFVTMQQPGLMITGYGLLGNLTKNWIELHENITTTYTAH